MLQFNPARGAKRPADNKRDRRLDATEYRALGKALAAAEDEMELPQAIAGTWLIALTGCRYGEVQVMKWSSVGIEGEALRLGDTKTSPFAQTAALTAMIPL